ncbi:MAG: glycine cleavage system protein H [Methanomicrobia archaeon]|nr:glycine cleavage system protein H [Methanomicrobia archaeon]MCK4309907.1 glycine cleavage system protein H [Methanomicrobia archaeon]MCK4637059.1 glycine cleavage system protein H [Methanomicrobia archaeon]
MNIRDYIFPENLYYSPEHLWVKREKDNTVVIGIDNYLQKSGVLDFVELPFEEEEYVRGEIFCVIGSDENEWEEELPIPLSGIILDVNEELEIDPEVLNNDCYTVGWLIRIALANPEEIKYLIHEKSEVKNWIIAEIAKEND